MPNATLYANPAQMLERFGEHELMLLTAMAVRAL